MVQLSREPRIQVYDKQNLFSVSLKISGFGNLELKYVNKYSVILMRRERGLMDRKEWKKRRQTRGQKRKT